MKNKLFQLVGVGTFSAIAASLCCITPVLALISGASGIASSFSWLEPARPYFIGITILVLSFAWYQKLKPQKAKEIHCVCEEEEHEKHSFWQSKKFLGIVTVFVVLMMSLPYYSSVFYSINKNETHVVDAKKLVTVYLKIEGMTCESCNLHVSHAAHELDGVAEAKADYTTGKAEVKYDPTKTSVEKIVESINATGYKVIKGEAK